MIDTENIVIYNKSISISNTLKQALQEKIEYFSTHVKHAYGNRTNNDSVITDEITKKNIALGKWGESFATIGLAKDFGFPLLKPDFKIYDYNKKSWEHDLPYAKNTSFPNVAVKTCSEYISNHYGLSWTFQFKHPQDDLFRQNDPNVIVALMYVADDTPSPNEGILVATVPWKKVVLENPKNGEILLQDPRSSKLVGIKKCLYFKDLQ